MLDPPMQTPPMQIDLAKKFRPEMLEIEEQVEVLPAAASVCLKMKPCPSSF